MQRNVQRFLDEKFIQAIDLELVAEFMERHHAVFGPLGLKLSRESEADDRVKLLLALARLNEPGGDTVLEELHRIATIAKEPGFSALRNRAELSGKDILPPTDRLSTLDMRCVAFRAFLRFPDLFEEAEDWWALERHTAVTEYEGEEPVAPVLNDDTRGLFEEGAQQLYAQRYREKYCRVRWYEQDGNVYAVVTHGVLPVTTTRIEAGREEALTFREAKQDILIYEASSGRLQVGARHIEEKRRLRDLFAEAILDDYHLFQHPRSRDLYTLERIRREGRRFRLGGFSADVVEQRLVELEVRESDENPTGWRIRVHDASNAVERFFEETRHEDFGVMVLVSATLRLTVLVDGKKRKKTVRIKPPGVASFNRSSGEAIVMACLQRNGFCSERHAPLFAG
jgi:hypothetical protein